MIHQLPSSLQSIKIGDSLITKTPSARNIGVMMDPTLCMDEHVKTICRSCYASIRDISRIRRYLTEDATIQLVIAFVISKLDTNNALLNGIADKHLDKLQRIQNTCAKLVKKSTSKSTRKIRMDLHWLPVKYRVQYKINVLTFKCLNDDDAPVYLRELLKIQHLPHETRSNGTMTLVRKTPKTETGARSFVHSAPSLWNALPVHLRLSPTLKYFKDHLKTHLFTQAFNTKQDEIKPQHHDLDINEFE